METLLKPAAHQLDEPLGMTTYIGQELDLFAKATRWKSYLARQVEPFLGDRVLEVGAGIGGMTKFLNHGSPSCWMCLEPDSGLLARVIEQVESGDLPGNIQTCTHMDQVETDAWDTALYMDVLEHIEDDAGELQRVVQRLKSGGHLVVLSPAHPFLFTPFDESIGHYRRYTRTSLRSVTPAGATLVRLRYLDSVGFFASLANRLLLRQSMPTERQVLVWDRWMVPCSTWVDPLIAYGFGKSVLGIWRKD